MARGIRREASSGWMHRGSALVVRIRSANLLRAPARGGGLPRGSMVRLNPVLMTALSAGLALIPLALAGGEPGNEIQSPMAIVVLGGLLSAVALNMLVVPRSSCATARRDVGDGRLRYGRRVREAQWIAAIRHPCALRVSTISSAPAVIMFLIAVARRRSAEFYATKGEWSGGSLDCGGHTP